MLWWGGITRLHRKCVQGNAKRVPSRHGFSPGCWHLMGLNLEQENSTTGRACSGLGKSCVGCSSRYELLPYTIGRILVINIDSHLQVRRRYQCQPSRRDLARNANPCQSRAAWGTGNKIQSLDGYSWRHSSRGSAEALASRRCFENAKTFINTSSKQCQKPKIAPAVHCGCLSSCRCLHEQPRHDQVSPQARLNPDIRNTQGPDCKSPTFPRLIQHAPPLSSILFPTHSILYTASPSLFP